MTELSSARGAAVAAPPEPWADLLDWLAGCFLGPPSPAAVARLREVPFTAMLAVLHDDAALRAALTPIRAVLASPHGDAGLAAILGHDFALLFDGAGGPRGAPPYASAYEGDGRRLGGPPAAAMDRLLRRHDLAIGPGLAEQPDHLSVELSLLAHLRRSGGDARPPAMRSEGWLHAFAARCAALDRHGFYAGLAALAAALVTAVASGADDSSTDDQPTRDSR